MALSIQQCLIDATLAEHRGELAEAEGLFNDALLMASAQGSVRDSAACHYQLALFLERARRLEEAKNVRKIADMLVGREVTT